MSENKWPKRFMICSPRIDQTINGFEQQIFLAIAQGDLSLVKGNGVIVMSVAEHEAILNMERERAFNLRMSAISEAVKDAKAKVWEEAARRFMDFTVEEMSLPLAWIIDRRVDEFKAKAAETRRIK